MMVLPIHEEAMPVILAEPKAWDIWLNGSVEEALNLQCPLAPEWLSIVAKNIRADEEPVQTRIV
jgi:putative SOS response-associated peptidase YedK